jgi:hypothetical protein
LEQNVEVEIFFEISFEIIGVHFQRGKEIFELYRSIPELTMNKVRNSYLLQLSHPHAQLEETWKQYTSWEQEKNKIQELEKVYLNSVTLMKERLEFEKNFKRIEDCLKYVDFEKDTQRKISLFERILIKNSKNQIIWSKFIQFLEENEKFELLLNVISFLFNISDIESSYKELFEFKLFCFIHESITIAFQ